MIKTITIPDDTGKGYDIYLDVDIDGYLAINQKMSDGVHLSPQQVKLLMDWLRNE